MMWSRTIVLIIILITKWNRSETSSQVHLRITFEAKGSSLNQRLCSGDERKLRSLTYKNAGRFRLCPGNKRGTLSVRRRKEVTSLCVTTYLVLITTSNILRRVWSVLHSVFLSYVVWFVIPRCFRTKTFCPWKSRFLLRLYMVRLRFYFGLLFNFKKNDVWMILRSQTFMVYLLLRCTVFTT